ncbi:hypothetical protein GEMRC1_005465 [Eukaryota sp. GEM-RC1]
MELQLLPFCHVAFRCTSSLLHHFPHSSRNPSFGIISSALGFILISFFPHGEWKQRYLRRILQYLTHVMVLSWCGVIKYHGNLPRHRPNQIYICNHTTMLDLVLLCQHQAFAVVGQQHQGWVGFIQNSFLSALGCIWFERTDIDDRQVVARRIKRHLCDPYATPLLVFPEGTCVGNDFIVQFKKGVFELGATVVPIGIKYNEIFVDAYWNSKQQSFLSHFIHFLTSWAVVADVYYLEATSIRPSETAIEFSNRARDLIAKECGLKAVPFDGYLKFTNPPVKVVKEKQQKILKYLMKKGRALPVIIPSPPPSPQL